MPASPYTDMTTRAVDPDAFGREIAHTADVGFEVEAPTLAAVFERAALTLLAVMVDLGGVRPRAEVAVAARATSVDELLHDWLQAFLVRYLVEGFAACEVTVVEVTATGVRAVARGERVEPARHQVLAEVKGVTYHQLAVRETATGWRARVILDV